MRTSILALLAALVVFVSASHAKEATMKRDDMMGFGDISAIDTLGGIGLGKRSLDFDEDRQRLFNRYRAMLKERSLW